MALLETLAGEFAYIESCASACCSGSAPWPNGLTRCAAPPAAARLVRRETLTQVQRLNGLALEQRLRARFDDIDAQTGEIIATLRNADSQTAYVRFRPRLAYRASSPGSDPGRVWTRCSSVGQR